MINTLIKKLFGKNSKAKPVKEPISHIFEAKKPLADYEILAEKLANMSEYEREIYYYEQSNLAGYRSPLQIAMDKADEKQSKHIARFEFSPAKQNFINVRSYCAFVEKSADETGYEKARNRVLKTGSGKKYLWTYIRNKLEEHANHRCVLCGASGKDQGFTTHTEAHEQWKYEERVLKDDIVLINGNKTYTLKKGKKVYVQQLLNIQSLCGVCHQIKHYNRWFSNEQVTEILKQYYMVQNDVSEDVFEHDLAYAYDKQKLLDRTYLLDISELFNIGKKAGFDNQAMKQLSEYQIDKLFNPHSEIFQSFLNREFISKGVKDEG